MSWSAVVILHPCPQALEEVQDQPKRRPLVRAASDESTADMYPLGGSPSPGDTLPWNLPKHHRIKRSKSASGDVLDPAERAIIRIAGTIFFFFFFWRTPTAHFIRYRFQILGTVSHFGRPHCTASLLYWRLTGLCVPNEVASECLRLSIYKRTCGMK